MALNRSFRNYPFTIAIFFVVITDVVFGSIAIATTIATIATIDTIIGGLLIRSPQSTQHIQPFCEIHECGKVRRDWKDLPHRPD
ncbi:MAG: hypothetical protein GY938_14190 [Ketobacter sp.]|nr:hypothetical protein [Ketobacter sp.]